jgi:hypothetical protein
LSEYFELGYDASAYYHEIKLEPFVEEGDNPITNEEEIVDLIEFSANNGDPLHQVNFAKIKILC